MTDYQSGFEVAGYRIESVIGRGGMAVVYRAEDTRLGRKVALKVLTPVLAHNEQFQQRFIRESRLAASLDHPNIVPIYEAGEADGQLFIAMRYVAGSDLKALLEPEGGRCRWRACCGIFVQIGDALDAAHELGLVHRDVKPGNILVASDRGARRPRLLRPRLPHRLRPDQADHVAVRGAHRHRALPGHGRLRLPGADPGRAGGARTDIYALGCVLYECLTGQLPFHRDDDAALLWAHLVEAPPPVSGRAPRPARGRRRRGRARDGQGARGAVRLVPRPGARPRARARRRRPAAGCHPDGPPGRRQPQPRTPSDGSADGSTGADPEVGPDPAHQRLGVPPVVPTRGDRPGAGLAADPAGHRRGRGRGPDVRPGGGRPRVRRPGGRGRGRR